MGLSNFKITDAAIAQKGVVAAPDKLTGTAAQNKAVFDRLIREAVKALFNGLIDELEGTGGAAEIGTTAIEGVTGGDVQTVLGSLKTILDTKSASADMTAALALKSDKSATDLHFKSVSLNANTGVFTFTREDGSFVTIDTVLEKVATNWQYDAQTQSLMLTLADGTTQSVPLSAFITETEFADSDQIAFSVSNHVVTATVKAGSITDTMLSSALVTQLQGCVSSAADSAADAAQSASAAEGYRTAAASAASQAANYETMAEEHASLAWDKAYAAARSADDAASDRSAASGFKNAAVASAADAEAWALGQRGGQDVPSTDETYHNNARYWAQQAEQAAGGGVTSFNSRSGAVTPQAGDYSKSDVGLGNVDNTSDADKPISTAMQTALNGKADKPVQTFVRLSSIWSGNGPYTQTVSIPGATADSEVSLRPNAAQLRQLLDDGVSALHIENDSGVFTAVAIGAAPSVEMKINATAEETGFSYADKFFFHSEDGSEFTLKTFDNIKGWNGILQYSTNGKDWSTWSGNTTLNSGGGYLFLRGTGNSVITGDNTRRKWVLTGSKIRCDGNIETLLDHATAAAGNHPVMAANCFSNMFNNCTALTTTPDLPATTLAANCYSSMFSACPSLTTAPVLPATTLAEKCYYAMFSGCPSLTTAPALPATTLAKSCYEYMFRDCTSLTAAPELPATTPAENCYSTMFKGCTALTAAPALPMTTLATKCYMSMFSGCTALATAPALPATTLAEKCYAAMFEGCTSLTTAPALYATLLIADCYRFMFSACTALKFSTASDAAYRYEYRIPMSGSGTSAGNALLEMFDGTGGTFTGTPNINTTYYTDHQPVS